MAELDPTIDPPTPPGGTRLPADWSARSRHSGRTWWRLGRSRRDAGDVKPPGWPWGDGDTGSTNPQPTSEP